MVARRVVQSLLALTLCLCVAAWLGLYYFVLAIAATMIAVSTGVYVLIAVAIGFAWPVLSIAYVFHVTRETRLRVQPPTHPLSTAKAHRLGVEDAKHREDRN